MFLQDLKAKVRAEAEVKRKYRHITIAQDLVMAARGKLVDRNWKRTVKPLNTPSQSNATTTSSSRYEHVKFAQNSIIVEYISRYFVDGTVFRVSCMTIIQNSIFTYHS